MRQEILICVLLGSFTTATAMAKEDDSLTAKVEKTLPPHVGACVLAIDHGKVIFEQAYGLADAEAHTPCTPKTNFRMASVSKQFTATAVMLLVDRGELSLDDKLTKFFPDFPSYGDQIAIKHLLTHTSGLPAYEDLIPTGTTLQLDDYDVLHLLMDTKAPRFTPGAKFEYSNSGYTLLGLIVEAVAKKPFQNFMADEIFKPLGMNESVLYQRGLNEVPHRAYGHQMQNGDWVRPTRVLLARCVATAACIHHCTTTASGSQESTSENYSARPRTRRCFRRKCVPIGRTATTALAGLSMNTEASRGSTIMAKRMVSDSVHSDFRNGRPRY